MDFDRKFREDGHIFEDAHAVLMAYSTGGISHAVDVAMTIRDPALSLVMMCAFASDLNDKARN